MGYNIEIQLFSFMILLIFASVFFSKSRMKNLQNQIYGILLVKLLLVTFFDTARIIAIMHHKEAGYLTDFFAKGYLCLVVSWVAMVSVYTLSLTRAVEIAKKNTVLLKTYAIAAGVTILTVWICIIKQELNYVVSGVNVYSYGTGVNIGYVFGLISVLHCFIVVIVETKRIPFIQRLSIYVYIGILIIAVVLQICCPTMLIISGSAMLAMIFMYFTLENPDMELIEELDTAKRAAEEASQAKAVFLANMSHEVRTPINAIIGMNEMILREDISQEVENYALQIEQAGHSLLSVVNDVLDISKIESGKIKITPVKYLLCSMVQELYSMQRLAAKRKKLEFFVEMDTDYPRILYGDEVRVKQVINNLLSNAVKYTKQGSVTLAFDYKRIDNRNMDMIVKVSDTGEGLKEEKRRELMQALQCMEEDNNYNVESLGLGLTITKQLLYQMNGSIEVESEYGKGSTFIVHMPQAIVDDTPIGDFEVHNIQSCLRQTAGGCVVAPQAKILIVDDCEVNLFVMASLLKQNKVEVTLEKNGEKVLEWLKENSYQIVFINYDMLGLNGEETMQAIKKERLKYSARFIELSRENVEKVYRERGFDDYLLKPIHPNYLEQILQNHLPREMQQI